MARTLHVAARKNSLGVLIDKKLSVDVQTKFLCKKAGQNLSPLAYLTDFTSKVTTE